MRPQSTYACTCTCTSLIMPALYRSHQAAAAIQSPWPRAIEDWAGVGLGLGAIVCVAAGQLQTGENKDKKRATTGTKPRSRHGSPVLVTESPTKSFVHSAKLSTILSVFTSILNFKVDSFSNIILSIQQSRLPHSIGAVVCIAVFFGFHIMWGLRFCHAAPFVLQTLQRPMKTFCMHACSEFNVQAPCSCRLILIFAHGRGLPAGA